MKKAVIAILVTLALPGAVWAAIKMNVDHSSNSVNSGLADYYTFDGSNINWNTNIVSDTGSNGTANNASTTGFSTTSSPVTGKIGQALNFSGGASNYLSLNSSIVGTTPYSMTAWIRPGAFQNVNDTFMSLIGNGAMEWRLRGGGNNYIEYRAQEGTGSNTNVNSLATSTWTHVAITVNGTAVRMYINGINQGGTQTNDAQLAGTKGLLIGNRGEKDEGFVGTMDDFRIYNRVLSDQEVYAIYSSNKVTLDVLHPYFASTTFPYSAGITLWWTFDGPNVNWNTRKVSDVSGNNNTGTIPSTLATSTTPTAGAIGQAFQFNASSVVNVTSSLGLTSNSPVYWGGWFYIPYDLTASQNGVISKYNGTTQGFEMEMDNLDRIRCGIDSGSGQLFGSTNTPTRQWFWAMCMWANGNLSLWVNGRFNNQVAAATFTVPAGAFQVGSVNNTGSFPGKIDNVFVGNQLLSTSTIYALYNQGRNTSRK